MTADGKRLVSVGLRPAGDGVGRGLSGECSARSRSKARARPSPSCRTADGWQSATAAAASACGIVHGQAAEGYAGHAKVIPGIAVNPSGTLIASTSHDGTLKLWAVP